METKNNFKFKDKIKSFYNTYMKYFCPKFSYNDINSLKFIALMAGLFTIVYSTMLFITAIYVYNHYDSKSGNTTSSTLLNQTNSENSTTSDNEKHNLRNSITDGDHYLPKQPLGFLAICGILLYVHVINSSLMCLYGALKEYKQLLLPWMISAPTSKIGFVISFFLYPCNVKSHIWAICTQIFGVFAILVFTSHFCRMIEYYGLLAERDRVKRAIDNLRPIPTVLPGETQY